MKIKPSNIIWGLCFIVFGILLFCKSFMDWDISLWSIVWRFWPLFIILPSISGMLTKGFNMSSLVGLLIGITFLLMTNNCLSSDLIRKLMVPVALVIIGIGILFKDVFGKTPDDNNVHQDTYRDFTSTDSTDSTDKTDNQNFFNGDSTSHKKPEYNAIFSSTQERFPNEIFTGTCINSVFGSVVLDLRDAIITEDVVINATVVFAGADIYVPNNVNIKVSSIPIFGGVSNKVIHGNAGDPTIYINATCMFGGLDIK